MKLADLKVNITDLVSPQLKAMSNRFGQARDSLLGFTKDTDKGLERTGGKVRGLNSLMRFARARNGLASLANGARFAASGMHPLVAGAGLAAVAIGKLGYEAIQTGKAMEQSLGLAQQILSGTTAQTRHATAQATALARVYGTDYTAVLQTAQRLTQQFGISSNEALDLIGKGFAAGGNLSGDLLAKLKESASSFKALGASAEEQMALLQQSVSMGVEDAPALLESFAERIPKLGGDVARLLNQSLGKGFTKGLQKSFEAGETTAIASLQTISEVVAQTNMSATTKQSLAEQLFGDTSGSALAMLDNFAQFDTQLSGLVEGNKRFNQSKSEQVELEKRLAMAQLQSSQGLATLGNWFTTAGIKAKIAFYDTVNWVTEAGSTVWNLIEAVGGFHHRIAEVIGITSLLSTTWQALGYVASGVWKVISTSASWLFEFVTNGFNKLSEFVNWVMNSSIAQSVRDGWEDLKDTVDSLLDYVHEPLTRLKDALEGIWTMMEGLKNFDYSQIKEGLSEVKGGLTGATARAREQREQMGINAKKVGEGIGKELKNKNENKSSLSDDFSSTNTGKEPNATSKLQQMSNNISAGGSQTRNISVVIERMVGIEQLHSKGVQEGADQMEQMVLDTLIRVVQGVEVAMNQG